MGKAKKIGIGVGIAVAGFFGLVIAAALANPNVQPSDSQQASDEDTAAPDIQQASDNNSNSAETIPPKSKPTVRVSGMVYQLVNATKQENMITINVLVENKQSTIEYVSSNEFRVIDNDKNLYEDNRLFSPDGEIAPDGSKEFKYLFRVPEEKELSDFQLVVLPDWQTPYYLDLV